MNSGGKSNQAETPETYGKKFLKKERNRTMSVLFALFIYTLKHPPPINSLRRELVGTFSLPIPTK